MADELVKRCIIHRGQQFCTTDGLTVHALDGEGPRLVLSGIEAIAECAPRELELLVGLHVGQCGGFAAYLAITCVPDEESHSIAITAVIGYSESIEFTTKFDGSAFDDTFVGKNHVAHIDILLAGAEEHFGRLLL